MVRAPSRRFRESSPGAVPPPETWLLIEDGRHPAAWNMAADESLLELAPQVGRPMLRCYGWSEAAATFGYSQRYADVLGLTELRPLVRRPTGGGLVPHARDYTYSLAFPPNHDWYRLRARESYERVHDWLRRAFDRLGWPTELAAAAQEEAPGQCFVGAEEFDVLWRGAKIAGAAQRRTRAGLLIQGSVQPPPGAPGRLEWQRAMLAVATEDWGVRWAEFDLRTPWQTRAAELAAGKYAQTAHNQRR